MRQITNKAGIITKLSALGRVSQLHENTWAIGGILSIPFCNLAKIHRSEFSRLVKSILAALGETEKEIYWIINTAAEDEWINANGERVVPNAKLYFLISDVTDDEGNPIRKHRADIYHLIHALWRYEVEDIVTYKHGPDNLDEELGLKMSMDSDDIQSGINISPSLLEVLYLEESNEVEEQP